MTEVKSQIYPWQKDQWEYVQRLLTSETLPHAILLTGPSGVGKHEFANNLAASIFCENQLDSDSACGACKRCNLYQANTYPDFIKLSINEEKETISVDEVRDLIAKLHLTSHFDAYKIALIEHADTMNNNAANALLKTLEEPPDKTLIILVASAALELPATIRSRCQTITLTAPTHEEARSWLNEISSDVDWVPLLRVSHDAPLQALKYHETELLDQRISVIKGFLELFESNSNPVEISARVESVPLILCFQWIQAVIIDLLRIKGSENPITLENPDFYRSLLALAPRMQVPLLLEYWEIVMERKKIFDKSLNRRLFVESLLIHCHKLALKHQI